IPITDGTGMHYSGITNAHVTEVLTWFGDVTQTATPDNILAKVYSLNADPTPAMTLGEGAMTSDMLTGSTMFVYSSIPITIGDGDTGGNDFMISIEYPGADDTLGIVSSVPDSADGAGEQRLRQLTTAPFGGTWSSIEALWGSFDCDAFIVPVIDDNPMVGIAAPTAEGLTLLGNFPNPASEVSTIRFSLSQEEEVHIKVFDMAAREIYNSGWVMTTAGEQQVQIDVSEKPVGSYYYTIQTRSTKLTSKLHVMK
ncbi:MAG: T9SS type A sorting domain-containing protein, partial [Bacteroidota bacterium]